MAIQVSIAPDGRMSLPAPIRKRLGLMGGGNVILEETDDGIMLWTTSQAVARAQAIARRFTGDSPNVSADNFIAQRRSDSGE